MAIERAIAVQDVPYPALLDKLEAAKQIVRPEAWKRKRTPRKASSPKA
jgi:hypothetical protein